MNRKQLRVGVFSVLLAFLMANQSQAQSSRPQQLKVAVSTATPHNTPLWVAQGQKDLR